VIPVRFVHLRNAAGTIGLRLERITPRRLEVGCDRGIMADKEWTVKDLIEMGCSFRCSDLDLCTNDCKAPIGGC
jgi:hypothetical protein